MWAGKLYKFLLEDQSVNSNTVEHMQPGYFGRKVCNANIG